MKSAVVALFLLAFLAPPGALAKPKASHAARSAAPAHAVVPPSGVPTATQEPAPPVPTPAIHVEPAPISAELVDLSLPSGSSLPILSFIGFGVIVGGIVSARKTRWGNR